MKKYILLLFIIHCSLFIPFSQAQMTLKVQSQTNTACDGNPCHYSGPSVLINEAMLAPSVHDGSIYDVGVGDGGEWMELYNPNLCKSVDVSCYYLGNNAYDDATGGNQNYGAGYRIPLNTIIPARGFLIIRGINAPTVPDSLLVTNGGSTVVLTADNALNNICIDGRRLWFPDAGGWFAFYDRNGVPQDAISWNSQTNSCESCIPCIASCSGCTDVPTLASYDSIPENLKTYITPENVAGSNLGYSWGRIPDGGAWSSSSLTPTMGYCNSTCNPPPVISCNGMAWVTPSGGTPPYTYIWNDSLKTAKDTAKGLCAGKYTVTVTDNNHNVDTISVIIKDIVISTTVTIDSVHCKGQANGSITVLPSGGTSPYNYIWNNGDNTSAINNLSAGNYAVTVTDKNKCTKDLAFDLISDSLPNVKINPVNPVICMDSTLTLYASGAKTYTWSPATGLSSTTGSSVTATPTADITYTLIGTIVHGCMNKDSVQVTVKPIPVVKVSPANKVICYGDTVHMNAYGAEYYSWSPATGLNSTSGSFVIAKPTASLSTYIVKGKNSTGCPDTASVKIIVNQLPDVNLGKDTVFCKDKSIVLNAGDIGDTYKWQDNSTNETLTVSTPGKYSVTVTDLNGCINSDSVKVSEDSLPDLKLIKVDTVCPGKTVTLNPEYSGSATYIWSDNSHGQELEVNKPGTYSVTVTDIHDCSSSATSNIYNYPMGKLNLGKNDTIFDGEPYPVINAGGSYNNYVWQDGTGGHVDSLYTAKTKGKYSVTVTDYNGCKLTDTIEVYEVCNVKDVFVPNVFVPDNGTICNVTFMIAGRCLGNVDVDIYNRWGDKIYWNNYDFTIDQTNINNLCQDQTHGDIVGSGKILHYIVWDGTDKRDGHKADQGAYFYIIKYSFTENANTGTQTKKGTITILR